MRRSINLIIRISPHYTSIPKLSGIPALNPTMISIDSNGIVRISETGNTNIEMIIVEVFQGGTSLILYLDMKIARNFKSSRI